MGAVTAYDPAAEHERTRVALAAALARLVELVGGIDDLEAPSGVPVWSVGDVGAHLAAAYLAFGAAVPGGPAGEAIDWEAVLAGQEGTFGERIAAVNALSVGLITGAERKRLGAVLAERGAAFLRGSAGLAPDTPVPAPWYGPGRTVPLAAATGLMLNETLLHGLDMARGARRPWPLGPEEASLVIRQAMVTMMPLALDTEKAQGVRLAFDLVLRGGPRLAVVIEDGAATVTRDAPPRPYDCRITAAPTAFLLVSFGRMPIWKAIALGRMRAGGRKPWLAPRLSELITAP
ncbi:maleylpyruvate isomerase N-terminal domain-containing protein [Streptomyces sp. NRRL F-5727]|uniref:maleylpyruvate isomerase N-terminal domain-containing protein n=1 Tax=Streptomyces sp. NRRL F-5727 TaxID=1463871 RepID=UPI0004CAD2C3|nr:maleylpyruvate isomerase N-terminal domain-containing protein [Streptomyces sp. NRRL F-5727]